MRIGIAVLMIGVLSVGAGSAFAGNIYITGHDVLLHSGQNGYDDVVLDFLRDGTPTGSYSIGVIGSGVGFWAFTGGGQVKAGYGGTTFYNTNALNGNAALQVAAVSHDVLIILSHTSCGGCDLSTAGSTVINTQMAAAITSAFNSGMDLWVNAGATLAQYYGFLPADFAATGPPIGGVVFCANAAGAALGLTNAMTQGFPTHNRFTAFDSSKLSVVETDCGTPSTQDISLVGKGIIIGDVPTVSEWGLIAMTLLLLAGGKIYFGRRTAVARA